MPHDLNSTITDTYMNLGAFSISLAVADLAASLSFYEALGFTPFGGDGDHYIMLRNGNAVIGLFEGLFDENILTFNPGWDQAGEEADPFTDVRDLERALRERGVPIERGIKTGSDGPGSFVLVDPDGNAVLVDQHVG